MPVLIPPFTVPLLRRTTSVGFCHTLTMPLSLLNSATDTEIDWVAYMQEVREGGREGGREGRREDDTSVRRNW